MSKFQSLSDEVLLSFARRLEFLPNQDNLIEQIKAAIHGKSVGTHRVNDIFLGLLGQLKRFKYERIKARGKVIITYDEWHALSLPCFEKGRLVKLIKRDAVFGSSATEGGRTFSRQAIDLGFNAEDVIEFDHNRVLAEYNLETWHQEGAITDAEKKGFLQNAILKWKPLFNETHLNSASLLAINQINNAKLCFFRTQQIPLHLNQQHLDTDISNGVFYTLADIPKIGWMHNWKDIY